MSQSPSLKTVSRRATTARGPRVGIVLAAVLHATLIGMAALVLQHEKIEIFHDESASVPVDLIKPRESRQIIRFVSRTSATQ